MKNLFYLFLLITGMLLISTNVSSLVNACTPQSTCAFEIISEACNYAPECAFGDGCKGLYSKCCHTIHGRCLDGPYMSALLLYCDDQFCKDPGVE